VATALTLPANLSLVEISAAATAPWRDLFAAPARAHVPYRAGTLSERNLLGARLDSAVTHAEGAVLLVAEGAGCFATAWWARLSPASYVSRVAGALFFDPIADEAENVESLMDIFASPRTRLPFPSIVLGRDDPHGARRAGAGARRRLGQRNDRRIAQRCRRSAPAHPRDHRPVHCRRGGARGSHRAGIDRAGPPDPLSRLNARGTRTRSCREAARARNRARYACAAGSAPAPASPPLTRSRCRARPRSGGADRGVR
jgi:uncharacterized protein